MKEGRQAGSGSALTGSRASEGLVSPEHLEVLQVERGLGGERGYWPGPDPGGECGALGGCCFSRNTRKENGMDGRKDSMIELEPKLHLEIRVTKRHEP